MKRTFTLVIVTLILTAFCCCLTACSLFGNTPSDGDGEHTFGEWTIVTAPTCTTAGEVKRTCSDCGETETKTVDALGHQFGEWEIETPATCTENGSKTRTCILCETTETETITAGHVYADDFTCHDRICQTCGEVCTATTEHSYNAEGECACGAALPKFTITFTGGELATGTAPTQNAVLSGTKITLPDNTFTNADYTFNGWNDGTAIYQPGDSYTVNADVSFSAVWLQIAPCVVSFKGGDGATGVAPIDITLASGLTATLPDNTFAKTDCTFVGWSDGNTTYRVGAKVTVMTNRSFTAVWATSQQIIVAFEGEDDSNMPLVNFSELRLALEGDVIVLPSNPYHKSASVFGGWLNDGKLYQADDSYTVSDANVTFSAVWYDIEKCYFELKGGEGATGVAPTIAPTSKGSAITLPENTFVKDGYRFIGWTTDGTEVDKPGDTSTVTVGGKLVTITAVWELIPKHSVSFAGGENATGTAPTVGDTAEDASFELPANTFERTEYVFDGWSDGTDVYQAGDSYTMGAADVVFTATWTQKLYAITALADNTYGGTVEGGGFFALSTNVTVTATTESDDFTWSGWYKDGEKVSDELSYSFDVTESCTLTAKWKKYYVKAVANIEGAGEVANGASYTVTFDKNENGEQPTPEPQTVTGFDKLTYPVLSDYNYVFTGWYTDKNAYNAPFDFSEPVTKDVTLYAGWKLMDTEVAGRAVNMQAYDETNPFAFTFEIDDNYTSIHYAFATLKRGNYTLYYRKTSAHTDSTGVDPTVAIYLGKKTIYDPVPGCTGRFNSAWRSMTFDSDGGNSFLTLVISAVANVYDYTCEAYLVCNDGGLLPDAGGIAGGARALRIGSQTTFTARTNGEYTFLGWFDEADNLITSELSANIVADYPTTGSTTTYTAKWGDYTVNLGRNDEEAGSVTGDGRYAVGDTVVITAESNASYTFLGWFDENDVLLTDDEDGVTPSLTYTFTMPSFNTEMAVVSYEARWAHYRVGVAKSISEAGTIEGIGYYALGETVTLTAETTVGYRFVGWFDNYDNLVEEGLELTFEMGAKDVTYVAKWTVLSVTIDGNIKEGGNAAIIAPNRGNAILTFNLNGGSSSTTIKPQTVTSTVGAVYPTITPSKNKCIFTGWYTTSDCTELFDFTADITYDTTVYAGYYSYANDTNSTRTISVQPNESKTEVHYIGTGYDGSSSVSNYFTAFATGTYKIEYCFWYTDSPRTASFYVKKCSTNAMITSATVSNYSDPSNENYKSVSFDAKAGDVFCVVARTGGYYSSSDYSGYINCRIYCTDDAPIDGGLGIGYNDATAVKNGNPISINAEAGSEVVISATADTYHEFMGWFDENDQLCTDNPDGVTPSLTYTFTMTNKNLSFNGKWELNAAWRDFTFTTAYNGATITGYTGTSAEVTIPDNTVAIKASVFENNTTITSVTISKGVTTIGAKAFKGCTNLTTVVIPDTIITISGDAFNGCAKLSAITIPVGVTTLGNAAFSGCSGLTSITANAAHAATVIEQSAPTAFALTIIGSTEIASNAFSNLTSLTALTLTESVTTIGRSAFSSCTNLSEITVSSNLKYLESGIFSGSAWWNNQPDGLVYLQHIAFKYKGEMPTNTSIQLAEGTTVVADYAFYYRTSLYSITLAESVVHIGGYAFSGCTNILQFIVTANVSSIGCNAFNGCKSYISIVFADTTTWYRTPNIAAWKSRSSGTSTDVSPSNNYTNFVIDTFNNGYSTNYWFKG